MKPLRNYVLIAPDKTPEATKSGILMVENWKSLPSTATVIAVGPKVADIKPKDRVAVSRYAVIEVDDPDLRLILDKHIMGIIDG